MTDIFEQKNDEEKELLEKIKRLKENKNAIILAHLYQWPEIQNMADFVGDSLELSRKAQNVKEDVIVFCGVYFMAETAKIISPKKTVLLPELDAGCPMADMITEEDIDKMKEQHPGATVVCYVNSSAEVKAKSDICCTSSNAVKVIKSINTQEIIFVPDQNLGHYVSRFVPEKNIILPRGFCPTHHKIKASDVENARKSHPDVPVLVHPECRPEVVDLADFTGSTAQIIEKVASSEDKTFIIGTENGIIHALQKRCPDKKFYSLHQGMICPNMKKTTLQSVAEALEYGKYNIELDAETIKNAGKSIFRMLDII